MNVQATGWRGQLFDGSLFDIGKGIRYPFCMVYVL